MSREVAELAQQIAGKLGTKLFRATIREAVAVKEAQISQQSLYSYAPKAKVTEDYSRFIAEPFRRGVKTMAKKKSFIDKPRFTVYQHSGARGDPARGAGASRFTGKASREAARGL